MRFIDLFAGIGGFRLGFEKEGFSCVFSSEIDKNCQDVYERNFGERPFGDITQVEVGSLPDFDVLLGGFPCQPFSISGKRKGFEDTRGTLFFHICEIIEAKRPKVVVLENVKFLTYHDGGNTFKVILRTLKELGYKVSYKLLSARDFGLPQYRERIFIIASRNGFFDFDRVQKKRTPSLRLFLDQDRDFEYLDRDEYTLIDNPKKQKNSGLVFVGYRNKGQWKKGVRPNTQHLSRVHRQPNRIYSIDGIHPTLPSQETSGRFFIYLPEEDAVRKLTIEECYRIMGFPESFIKDENTGRRYLQIGNSVAVPVVNEIARSIKTQSLLSDEPREIVEGDLRTIF